MFQVLPLEEFKPVQGIEVVLQLNGRPVGQMEPLNIQQGGPGFQIQEFDLVLPGGHLTARQHPYRVDLPVDPAHVGKAHGVVSRQLALKLGPAHIGPLALLLHQIALGAQLVHRPAHRNAAHAVELAQLRL